MVFRMALVTLADCVLLTVFSEQSALLDSE